MKNSDSKEITDFIIANPVAWPGGYEIFGICTDGEILCHTCVKENREQCSDPDNDGWTLEGYDATCNTDEYAYCANCNKFISPFGDTLQEHEEFIKDL